MMLTHTWIDQLCKTLTAKGTEALVAAVRSAVQFDCGDVDAIPVTKSEDMPKANAPYPATLLQFETPCHATCSHITVLWLDEEDGNAVLICAVRQRADKAWITVKPCRIGSDGTKIRYQDTGATAESYDAVTACFEMAKNLFFVLGCSNVATIEHPPPVALNKKRAKAGKLPLMSHKTLVVVVDEARAASQHLGGTHSSPRLHLRRGHVRNLGEGRRVWVQPCVVGSKHGIVTKDYCVKTSTAIGHN